MSFFELFYQMDDLKSGMHDPDGMLWIRMPDKQFTTGIGKGAACSRGAHYPAFALAALPQHT